MLVRGAGFASALGEVATATLDNFFAREHAERVGVGESQRRVREQHERSGDGDGENEERAGDLDDSERAREAIRIEPRESQLLGRGERGREGEQPPSGSWAADERCRRSQSIAFLKVDTEGMDGRVLRGARRLLECNAIQVCVVGGRGVGCCVYGR